MGSKELTDSTNAVSFMHPCAGKIAIFDHEKAVVEEICPDGSPRRRVAIVGFAQSSKDLAPFNDPTWSIWGCNQLYRHIPRADRWFEIHHNWDEHVVTGTDHRKWLAEAPIPIYMVDCIDGIPNSVRFPIERVMCGHPDYFTSTIAFALALAIHEGFEEIGLYGVDLAVGTEYMHQRPCAEFWIGIAHAKGIKITLPGATSLIKSTYRYGYQLEPDSIIKESELLRRRHALIEERKNLMTKIALVDGALEENKIWVDLLDLRLKGVVINP